MKNPSTISGDMRVPVALAILVAVLTFLGTQTLSGRDSRPVSFNSEQFGT